MISRAPHSETHRFDRIAAGLMLVLAVSAFFAFFNAIGPLQTAPPDRLVVGAWRTLGFLLFAGLFALLALFPRRLPGLWELVFLHKAGMACFALFYVGLSAPEAEMTAIIDGALAGITLFCYFLARGYLAWSIAR
jgi:hypothetical protein